MREIAYDNYFWQESGIRLRAMKIEDSEVQYHNRFDTDARRLVDYEVELPPTSEECNKFAETFANFAPGTGRLMFTIESLEGENIGSLNINGIDERNGTFGIGMQVDRDYRGKGYGTSAMIILLRYAFLERRLNKFNVSIFDGNIGSSTMLKKLGCKQEGIRRQVIYTNGKYVDEIFFGLTKDEFIESQNIQL
ncbi:GNAT family N-acetyltransferase [Clostridium estertheticum]|uniref:GNAT family N-acetyltransferase n=1 Tax=Clostridium estertheticum TaxID=238834 RepID=UPI001C0E4413|nr:GNAT family protein [Clostridium estertheticum]MBU3175509.1 GNAT family N-acetyltransferase [Clostridium estertheticum]